MGPQLLFEEDVQAYERSATFPNAEFNKHFASWSGEPPILPLDTPYLSDGPYLIHWPTAGGPNFFHRSQTIAATDTTPATTLAPVVVGNASINSDPDQARALNLVCLITLLCDPC